MFLSGSHSLLYFNSFEFICQLFWVIILTLFSYIIITKGVIIIYGSVRKNRKVAKYKSKVIPTTPFSLERVICLVKENDIIEFEIIADKYVEKVGSSSDYDKCKDIFFDKRFYVGENEYLSSAKFTEALSNFSIDGKIKVIAVDGVKTKNLK